MTVPSAGSGAVAGTVVTSATGHAAIDSEDEGDEEEAHDS